MRTCTAARMRVAARAVSTMWSGPEGRGVARDGDERPPRARPFEHRAQGPMGCVRVGSLARRGERAAAAGRRLGSSSAHTGGSPWRSDAATRRRRYQVLYHDYWYGTQVLYHGTVPWTAALRFKSRAALCAKKCEE